MNFKRGRQREELEINLIPLIDVLLVILIFLMVTTTYSKTGDIETNLPTAEREDSFPETLGDPIRAHDRVTVAALGAGQIDRDVVRLVVGQRRFVALALDHGVDLHWVTVLAG